MSSHPRSARLEHVFVLTTLALLGCHGGGTKRPSDATLETQRTSCAFAPGAKPSETIGGDFPIGDQIPIDHFFIFMQENRSFDHYFGTMPGVDGLPANASNPDKNGTPVPAYHETEYCISDVEHGWDGTHVEWNNGANDGFVVANDPNGTRGMGYFDATDLPYYHALYSTFAMSQRHFCSLLGPTWVNRMYMVAGTSFGLVDNIAVPDDRLASYGSSPATLYEQLDAAGVEWRVYAGDAPTIIGLFGAYGFGNIDKIRTIDMLAADLASGDVAAVTFVEPSFLGSVKGAENDEHPPTNPQKGQAFIATQLDAIMHSSVWPKSAIVLTYDEHGGFYDHVPPPPSCVPDDFQAVYADLSPATNYTFDHYGFRVPLVVVSPFAKRHYVSNRVTDHTSILRLVQARYGLGALTNRDANAWPLLDMFDFAHPDTSIPSLPAATIDPTHAAACAAAFP